MIRYYLKLGLLSIRANPMLSGLMVAAIAIGIGACMTIVTVNYIMSGNPIPHKSDQLFYVQVDNWSPSEPYNEPNEPPDQVTYLDATALFAEGRADRQVISYQTERIVQPADDDTLPFRVSSRATTADFFAMFDVPFLYGTGWESTADDTEGHVAVINQSLNARLFGGEDSIGRTITLNGEDYTVVGVLDYWVPIPRFYDIHDEFDEPESVFYPFSTAIAAEHDNDGNTSCWKPVGEGGRSAFLGSECVWMQMWVELDSDAKRQEYTQFLNAYTEQQKLLGRFPREQNNRLSNVEEWLESSDVVDEDVGVLLGLAILFLIVCLLNTIGLLLAKVLRRSTDISLRRALGANKSALFAQYIIEAGIIGTAGGLLGIAFTWLGLRGIESLFADFEFIANLVRMDWVMIMAAVALAIVSALGAAIYPTWRACNIPPASELRLQ
jgi:putative ABC transport system permease protein